jgi:hypothetical protein
VTPSIIIGVLGLVALAIIDWRLGRIFEALERGNEHARIVRQHDLPEIVRHLEAINANICNLQS